MQYLAKKTLDYFDGPRWAKEGLTVWTAPYEATDAHEAYERAFRAIEEVNPFISAMPGLVHVYRLDPVADPMRVGALQTELRE